jgi:hypothetical protein
MPYTKNPTMDTYSSEDIDITREISTRAGNTGAKDEDYLNVFLEDARNKYATDNRQFVLKRAGSSLLIPSVASGTVRGSFYWADQMKLFFCVGQTMYIYKFSNNTTTTLSSFFSTSTGDVGFTDYLYDNGTSVVIISDGQNLKQIDTTNAITTCTDPDLPTPFDPHIVFFDGYVVVCKNNTGDIYNSDANAPLSWTPGNFLNAEIEADYVHRLAKVNNYLIAFGTNTIEYFWDAGNPTGSPFQRNDTPIKRIQYLSGFAQVANQIMFIGRDYQGQIRVFRMQDFKVDPVSTETIVRNFDEDATVYTSYTGVIFAHQGHTFYAIYTGDTGRTYCLDLDNGLWTRIGWQGLGYFPFQNAHCITNAGDFTSLFTLNDATTNWYQFDESLFQDNGVNFNCIVTTEQADFGTMNRKNMHRLTVVGDRPPVNANMTIQWTDDDYQTYNTGQTVNLNQDLPCIRQLGNFRQRGFKLTFTNNTMMRIQKMVADINKGNS